ncbi:DNA-binding transcriptional regulator YhcF (GntR family) [Kibdelosporangium banguiense]|uniref:DNA-binding transcriptional regulator YhcF (GntR family) n=1 Tax=Kibdelosporangium banguiense TaxID=1365924 RepID=A0ABS4TP11_9PSEU|nr:GntR family transcriptional regulator [Kibdelosporangium banguiense]MBP2326149.1 DNA-binding transcriptional regulator YhcF (GntR family) [Kibdelosporangium banguiense]
MNRIVVDPDSGIPPWRQIKDQFVRLIQLGALPVGAQLPSIRQLARDLGLSTGTVARVYRELEAAGVLQTARRAGTVVAAIPTQETDSAAVLDRAAAEFVLSAKALGMTVTDALHAVERAWD